jgi:hypothetical protein
MSVKDDVATTRRAVAALEDAASRLVSHFGDSVDVRRLAHDVGRLRADIELLCGSEPSAPPPKLEAIPDKEYPYDFWSGSDDEGLGAADRHAF